MLWRNIEQGRGSGRAWGSDGGLQTDFIRLMFFLKGLKHKIVCGFLQEKLLGLMSLPTREQFEELKKKRKQEMERKRILERQASEMLLAASWAQWLRQAPKGSSVRSWW